ncbi:hypothetical protein GL263_01030 [Streptomyces durbertensis]|uniref:Uncharacterized protein n=1 Tax=Streptomyces durbertensis TaxID=2448886 RepID=A0ABR6EAA0_9ACTN|nr:hypothetical protein [Streptomyces durbertensis]MBB1242168.1 hypothetical protein [Streptomyces durbertensis]
MGGARNVDTRPDEREWRRLRNRANDNRSMARLTVPVAVVLWLWFAFLLLTPYSVENGHTPIECRSPLGAALSGDNWQAERCAEKRRPATTLGMLGLATLTSVAALGFHLNGSVMLRALGPDAPTEEPGAPTADGTPPTEGEVPSAKTDQPSASSRPSG